MSTRLNVRSGAPATITVAALSSAFGCTLVLTVSNFDVVMGDSGLKESETITMLLSVGGALFFSIAAFVGAIVTANTVSTVIAGRTREIALLRLIGATGRSIRRDVLHAGFVQSAIGTVIGGGVGVVLVGAATQIAIRTKALPEFTPVLVVPAMAVPAITVLISTVFAAWWGSRRVLEVSPIQATSSGEPRYEEVRAAIGRNITAVVLVVVGFAAVIAGIFVGQTERIGVLVSIFGGMVSFSGVILGGVAFFPPLISLIGRLFGTGSVARLASQNAVRNPARSARAVIGLVIGVTLATTFAVAAEMFRQYMLSFEQLDPAMYGNVEQFVNASTAVMGGLLGFSVLLAVVGIVNTLSLSVMQRRRELGLIRALGFTVSQVRILILVEAAQMIISASLFGLALGTFYGWAGASATFGSVSFGSGGAVGMLPPAIPVPIVLTVLVLSVSTTLMSAAAPARRATRVTPVVALAVE